MAKQFTTGEELLEQVMNAQTLKAESVKHGSRLDYNLEVKLDTRRKQFKALTTRFKLSESVDFSSNDILSLSASGLLRKAFDAEMAKYPGQQIGSGGSRLLDGSHPYTENLEASIAKHHGVEGAMVLSAGVDCNYAVFGTLPQKDDFILYDELVHASIHDGLARSRCKNQVALKHNDLIDFEHQLRRLREENIQLKDNLATLFIAVEAIYSMDGDIVPLAEMVALAKQVYPEGNASFIVDEAHATGLLGEHGKGLVGMLGLEKEIAIRVHTYSKAMASQGGVILCNSTVRNFLMNFSRAFMFTAAPTFCNLAAIKVGYDIFKTDELVVRQFRIQWLVRLFCARVRELKHYQRARETGYLAIPVAEDFQNKPFMSHIVPLWSSAADALSVGLIFNKITAYPVAYPVVPKGQKRVRLVFHAGNTESDVDRLIMVIGEWLEERFKDEVVAEGASAALADTWEDYGNLHGKQQLNGNGIGHAVAAANGNAKAEIKAEMNGTDEKVANGMSNGHEPVTIRMATKLAA